MATGGPSTAHAGPGGPKPALPPLHNERVEQREGLSSWWRGFKKSDKKTQEAQDPHGIFGVPLGDSIRYANVAISLFNDDGQSYIYGYVPIVVAKCGVYLKEKATDVEGIFRLAGSEKRIKELKIAFDSPDRYGKGLDWTGYTVHDAANILRRYFNQLPEPIIPLDFYERFRQPLRDHQSQAVGAIEAQSPSVGDFDHEAAIRAYQGLITELPPLNRQLLLYILDLLAVFASKSDLNKMTTQNLAAIFQPGILSHPQHDMAPQEYRLSQDVLIFLIENQDSFLIGMQGTAADPDTVRDVQSGTPSRQPSTPTTPNRAKTLIGRSSSNASVGADSVRRFGNIRRNVSVSSKHSKRSEGGPTPVTPSITSPTTPTSGVHRSSTVPSRRTGSAAQSPRFSRDKTSEPPTPSPGAASITEITVPQSESIQSTPIATARPAFPPVALPEVTSPSSSEATTPMATVGSNTSSAIRNDYMMPKWDTTPLLAPSVDSADHHSDRSQSNATSPAPGGGFLGIFKQSPTSDSEGRKPKKLQKKRIPGSSLSSAQSSSQSLHDEGAHDVAPHSPVTPSFPFTAGAGAEEEKGDHHSAYTTAQTTPVPVQVTPHRTHTDATLRPTTSPTQSYHSTDMSDADMVGDDMPRENADQPEKEKKRHRWRFSRSQNKLEQPQTPSSGNPLGTMSPRDQAMSRSTIGSTGGSQPSRRSIQEPTPLLPAATDLAAGTPVPAQQLQLSSTDPVFSDSERERERRGPVSWIRGKLQDRKDKEAEKRAKTPERNRDRSESKPDLRSPSGAMPVRGKSFEQQQRAGIPNVGGSAAGHAPAGQSALAGQVVPTGQPSTGSPAMAAQAPAGSSSAQGSPASRPLNGHGRGEGQP
ncbi:hypothetical protein LTR36_001640 [Oleoguttula mirabilis]|uniref:Rho-GAP domain-containing protein n=1 Tax=Oleoguttula mirabilis TaxID=1507867 RepID=A0AAV9JNH3_9PEZI|nr:hypothetical protein LTR36_001640 [Oleoguttula mirabilis]